MEKPPRQARTTIVLKLREAWTKISRVARPRAGQEVFGLIAFPIRFGEKGGQKEDAKPQTR
jgi:hypothetical protein